jgi:hypothetical protein
MNIKLTFTPPRTARADQFTTTVTWDATPELEYQVTLSFPPEFTPEPSAPPGVTLARTVAVPKDHPQGAPYAFTHIARVPEKLADGKFPVTATVAAPNAKPASVSDELYVGDWLTPGFIYKIKENFDQVMGSLSSEIRGIGDQLATTNNKGLRLQRATNLAANTQREQFWNSIRQSAEQLKFEHYSTFIEDHFCDRSIPLPGNMRMPFSQVDSYLRLKAFTELFLLSRVGVVPGASPALNAIQVNAIPYAAAPAGIPTTPLSAQDAYDTVIAARPYLRTVLQNNADLANLAHVDDVCNRLRYPVFIELFWSYWHEEALIVQAMHRITLRFQNRSDGRERDPLAQLEMDPLRPLNSILWGYIQDEQHRLSVKQRAREYEHQYGLTLEGRAVGRLRTAESRSAFLRTFHNLLFQAVQFFRQADDTTVVANASPLLYALRDLQQVLATGAHNVAGDLPWNARLNMLMEQWILARPEIQDFLRGRRMIPYAEGWMGPVDTLKSLQGWNHVSVVHFRDLGVFGEQLLLSVREGGVSGTWNNLVDSTEAAAWALNWRPEIEGYIHAYRSATGVDLSLEAVDARALAERDAAPSLHLRRREARAVAR